MLQKRDSRLIRLLLNVDEIVIHTHIRITLTHPAETAESLGKSAYTTQKTATFP